MKIIKYNLCMKVNLGTEENPKFEERLFPTTLPWSERNEEIAKREAYKGEYAIEDDGQPDPNIPIVNRNVTAGEYIIINNILYKAIVNIPNGGRIIVGQNAVITTVEEQLYELTKGE